MPRCVHCGARIPFGEAMTSAHVCYVAVTVEGGKDNLPFRLSLENLTRPQRYFCEGCLQWMVESLRECMGIHVKEGIHG